MNCNASSQLAASCLVLWTLVGTAAAGDHAAADCVSWDTSIGSPGMNVAVRALAVLPGGDVIAGGQFNDAGGMPANHIARWDGEQWHGLGEGLNGAVTSLLALDDGDVIAAGLFTVAGDVPANRIARWDGDQWHAMGGGIGNGFVWSLIEMPDGDVVAAGSFTMVEGAPVNRIARWDGSQWHPMGGGMDAPVRTLAIFDRGDGPGLYAGGEFLTADGAEVNYIARWDEGASTWQPLPHGVNGHVLAMAVHDDGEGAGLYVAGQITHAGAMPLFNRVGRFDGEKWWPFSGGMNGTIVQMAAFNAGDESALYAAETLIDNGQSKYRLLRWDGSWWKPIGELSSSVQALAADGASLYAGGGFATANGLAVGGIIRWEDCPVEPRVRLVPSEYATIQGAIDAAEDGDMVLVAPGTYEELLDFLGKTIVVQSEEGAGKTVISGVGHNQSVVRVSSGAGVGTTLRGFTIVGGKPNDSYLVYAGCVLVLHAVLTVDQCVLRGERGYYSRGIEILPGADVLVTSTMVYEHHAYERGAGVRWSHNRHARFRDCVFASNSTEIGGALSTDSLGLDHTPSAVFERCLISDNHAATPNGGGFAGGGFVAGVIAILNCDFEGNHTPGTGGAVLLAGYSYVRDCRFAGNSADRGGAVYGQSIVHIESSTFNENRATQFAGALYASGSEEEPRVSVASSDFCSNSPEDIVGHIIDLGGNSFADSCEAILGDLNGDGVVDVADLLILLSAYGDCPQEGHCPADLNGDGAVDVSDLLILLANWG